VRPPIRTTSRRIFQRVKYSCTDKADIAVLSVKVRFQGAEVVHDCAIVSLGTRPNPFLGSPLTFIVCGKKRSSAGRTQRDAKARVLQSVSIAWLAEVICFIAAAFLWIARASLR
jgi:hypothetical protein